MRIGLLGGTFNPIHNGHIAVAVCAKTTLKLDKVIFIPTFIPPVKGTAELIGAELRYKMVELAITGTQGFEISRFEIDNKTVSYTIETLEYFHSIYPGSTEFFFLVGEDSLAGLSEWKRAKELFKLCTFAVFARAGFVPKKDHGGVIKIAMEPVDISSSEIRRKIKSGKDIKGLVPDAVLDYIKTNNLYK